MKRRLVTVCCALAVVPALLFLGFYYWSSSGMLSEEKASLNESATQDLDHIVSSLYHACAAQHEVLTVKLHGDLQSARVLLDQLGSLSASEASGTYEISGTDQASGQATEFALPRLLAGSIDLTQDTALVDRVQEMTGSVCTVVQRTPQGHLLRVATSVRLESGERARGTYIPASSPVAQAINAGHPYEGTALVVGEWYQVAYEPLTDASGSVIGALFVGSSLLGGSLADFSDLKIGETGYPYAITADGVATIHPTRAGENLYEMQDSSGNRFIQTMCETASNIDNTGQDALDIQTINYPWKNDTDPAPRNKIVRYTRFEPWNWVIAAGSYEDEFYRAVTRAEATQHHMLMMLLIGTALLTALAVGVSIRFSGRIIRPLTRVGEDLNLGADELTSASGQLSASSQSLAEGSTEQAASLEEVSASLEEMSSMAKQSSESAQQVADLIGSTQQLIGQGEQSMSHMVTSMTEIRESSSKITNVLKMIEEIAFQVNLLALNAAVEAARAGEHGRGFAVVADEVRSLAMRASEAVKTTGEVIGTAVKSSEQGSKIVEETSKIFDEIAQSAAKVASLSAEVNTASREQAAGISQVSEALTQIDQVTQSNSASAEECASAAEEAQAQAVMMRDAVSRLSAVIAGTNRSSDAPETAAKPEPPKPAPKAAAKPREVHADTNGAPKNGAANGARRRVAQTPKPSGEVDLSKIEF